MVSVEAEQQDTLPAVGQGQRELKGEERPTRLVPATAFAVPSRAAQLHRRVA